jgi:predicted dehydrogenase
MQHPLLQLAQIGCGYWGPNLLRNFSALKDCGVKYVVDTSLERRQYIADNFSRSQPVAELGIVLEDPAVEAVVIATPARTHFALAKQALLYGKHALVEKPLAMSLAEVDELGTLAAKRHLTLMVGHSFLFNPAVTYLKQLVDQQQLGRIYYAYSQRLNLGVIRPDVNALWNLAPHDVSIFCYLFDATPVHVRAEGTDYIQPDIEDVVFLQLEFPGKIRAHIQVSWLDPNKLRRLTLVGSRKMDVYDDLLEDKIAIYDKGIECEKAVASNPFDALCAPRFVHRAGDILLPKVPFREPLRIEAEHFVHCVRSGKAPLTGVAHARQVVGVLAAAQESLRRSPKPGGATAIAKASTT